MEFGSPEEEAYWVASEIERLHEAGAPWRSFAVLYRKHTHRNQLLDALRRKRIPFVIRKFSILSSTLVRDLLAYLRLIAVPVGQCGLRARARRTLLEALSSRPGAPRRTRRQKSSPAHLGGDRSTS